MSSRAAIKGQGHCDVLSNCGEKDYVKVTPAMEVKVAGRQFQSVGSRQFRDIKRALNCRTKVKVSTLLSPESQKAMLMVREETIQNRYFHNGKGLFFI